jgi:hypothetical protein
MAERRTLLNIYRPYGSIVSLASGQQRIWKGILEMTHENSERENGPPNVEQGCPESPVPLALDWTELFFGPQHPTTVLERIRKGLPGNAPLSTGQEPSGVKLAELADSEIEGLCSRVRKKPTSKKRLSDILRVDFLSDSIMAPVLQVIERVLASYADEALMQAVSQTQPADSLWQWLQNQKKGAFTIPAWQALLAAILLCLRRGGMTRKQVDECLWRALLADAHVPPECILDEFSRRPVLPVADELCTDLVGMMLAKGNGMEERLLLVLQCHRRCKPVVLEQVILVAEVYLKNPDNPLFARGPSSASAAQRVHAWLSSRREEVLPAPEVCLAFCALLVGLLKREMRESDALSLLESVLTKPVEVPKPGQPAEEHGVASTVLSFLPGTDSEPAFELFRQMMARVDAQERHVGELRTELMDVREEKERLKTALNDQSSEISQLRSIVADLEQVRAALQDDVGRLEKDLSQFQDGLTHRIDQLRSKVRAALEGPATRHLQNALEAIQADPPWIEAAEERIEDAMNLLRKEAECLQPLP